jgi:Xaa-Pro aminopeptidase
MEPVKIQPFEYSGKKFEDKFEDLRKELEKRKSLGFVVCMYSHTLHPQSY